MKTYRDFDNYLKNFPDEKGYFGEYGGMILPPELVPAFKDITEAYAEICNNARFINELRRIRKEFQGRPTPVYHCERLSSLLGKCQIYLKREDLNHTGAHKINHCMGEGLLAKFLGKKKLIAETGAGQHGVALATAAAYFGLECDIYMGEVDIAKQHPNVIRMKMLGANVIPATHGLKTLKEAVDAAFEAYLKEYKDAIYCIGSAVGPHPFPMIVRDFQSIVGIEAKDQFKEMTGNLPDVVCVEPLGRGSGVGDHAASMTFGKKGTLHGFESLLLQDENGEPLPVYSIASGLDYPSVGPEHAYLKDCGRVKYEAVTDDEAMQAFFLLSRYEGIIPAIESSHALAYAIKHAKNQNSDTILVNLSGRGDKDIDYVYEKYGTGEQFLKEFKK